MGINNFFMEFGQKNEQERRDNIAGKKLESRITAGPITDIVPLDFVKREGFCMVSSVSEKIELNKFRRYFVFYSEGELYYDKIAECINKDDFLLNFNILNRALNKENLYFAHYRLALPAFLNKSTEEKKVWVIGQGDLYSAKDISVDEVGEFRELSLGRR